MLDPEGTQEETQKVGALGPVFPVGRSRAGTLLDLPPHCGLKMTLSLPCVFFQAELYSNNNKARPLFPEILAWRSTKKKSKENEW